MKTESEILMTSAKVNLEELSCRLIRLKHFDFDSEYGELCISRISKHRVTVKSSDRYVANLFVNGEFCMEIGTVPTIVEPSDFANQLMKMQKWA